MLCDRCDKPISRGQAYDTMPIDSGSGPGGTVNLHQRLCTPPPHQTAPARPMGAIRG